MNSKIIASIAGLAALAIAGAASAQTAPAAFGTNLTINLSGQVETRCNARLNAGSGTTQAIDFGQLAQTLETAQVTPGGQGSVTYICNDPDGFTRTVTSASGGWLVLDGNNANATDQARRIRYTMQHGGGSGLDFAERQLTAPVTSQFNGSTAFLSGQTGGLTLRANGVAYTNTDGNQVTRVFAGNYTDVVTIAVAAR